MKMWKKVVLFIASMCVFSACGESTPKDVAKDYLKLLYTKENAELIKFIDVPKEQRIDKVIRLGLANAIAFERKKQRGGLAKIEAISENIEGEKAAIKMRVIFRNGIIEEYSFNLQKINGKWKIDGR